MPILTFLRFVRLVNSKLIKLKTTQDLEIVVPVNTCHLCLSFLLAPFSSPGHGTSASLATNPSEAQTKCQIIMNITRMQVKNSESENKKYV